MIITDIEIRFAYQELLMKSNLNRIVFNSDSLVDVPVAGIKCLLLRSSVIDLILISEFLLTLLKLLPLICELS